MKQAHIRHWFNVVLGLAMMVCLYPSRTTAQVQTGDQLPDALKGVKQATGACRRDDLAKGVSDNLVLTNDKTDLGCAIAAIEIQQLRNTPNTALIDLRPANDYQTFHIDGALNLQLPDLRSKPYWRDKTVVLIGSGKADREIYAACYRLKQEGYKQVRVLRGGMIAWLVHNHPVVGRAPSATQLARLSPSEFWLENQNDDNVVLLGKEQAAVRNELPISFLLSQTTGEVVKAALERRRKETKNSPLAAVVLAVDPSTTDEQIARIQHAIQPVPLLVYADTRDAFVRHLNVQKSIWAAQARGPRQPNCGL